MKKKWFVASSILIVVLFIYSVFITVIMDKRVLLSVFDVGYVDKTKDEEILYHYYDYEDVKDTLFYYQTELQLNPTNFEIPKDSLYPWMQPAFEKYYFGSDVIDTPEKACKIAQIYFQDNISPIQITLDEEKGIWILWTFTRTSNPQYIMLAKSNGALITNWKLEGLIDGSPRWYDGLISGLMGYDYLEE